MNEVAVAEKNEMRVLGGEGDSKTTWDPDNNDEVEVAKTQFDSLVAKKYNAFLVKKDGEKGKKLYHFDPKAAAMILVPPVAGG